MTDTLQVVLVEDNPGDARLVREMFRDAIDSERFARITSEREIGAVDVHHADTLQDGLELIDDDVDVVLLDLQLPDSNGLETVEAVLDAPATVPVVVLTGMPEESRGTEAVALGAQDYLSKDGLTADALVRTIQYSIERHRIQRELRQRTRELAILNQLMRHDIKNDASLVVGRASELTEHVDARGEPLVDEVIQASNHILQLTRTIGDILESVADDGPGPSTVDLGEVLESEVEKARQLYRGTDIALEAGRPVTVRGDKLLASVFGNLITNGVLYNDKEDPSVTVTTTVDEDTVTVHVADNGPGIPDGQKDAIFAEGFSEEGGSGIGLALVVRLVDRYDGEVRVEDNDPHGSVFHVTLRRAE